jgi:hypothetical protein
MVAVNVVRKDFEARFWHWLDDGRVQCDLCPRFCKLHEKQRGLCFVRARRSDRMVLTIYGRSSWKMLDRPSTRAATLGAAQGIARRVGLRYVYTGNVRDEAGQSAYCHACGERVIGRD